MAFGEGSSAAGTPGRVRCLQRGLMAVEPEDVRLTVQRSGKAMKPWM